MLDKDSKKSSSKVTNKKKVDNKKTSTKNKTNSKTKNVTDKTKTNTKIKNVIDKPKTKTKIKSVIDKNETNTKIKNITDKTKKKNPNKAIFLALFITLSLLVIASSYYLLKTSKFNITSIAVVGNNKVNVNEVITKSEINIGDNIVKSFFKVNKDNILNIPYISNVNVSINFPSELVIKVNERISVYYAYDKEKNVYYRLDKSGVILEVCDNLALKEKELLVNGITFDSVVKLGTKINDIDYSKILVYKNIEENFYNSFSDELITKVNFENSLTKIYLNDKIEVILPNDTNLKYNLTFLKDIITKIGDKQGTIDMTKENPTFISF